jgi:NAD(P)-dependent dehydrogenase (short-subunit alcohol dehydrogenase family)
VPRRVAALGQTHQLPPEDRYLLTRSQLEDRLCVLMGGRSAERLVFREVSSGAQSDLTQASELARRMVEEPGMSDRLGPIANAALPHLLSAAAEGPRGSRTWSNVSSVAGRVARSGSGVYNATKHGVGAFSEALRQELTGRHLRVSLIEPGAVATELAGHNRPEVRERIHQRFEGIERLQRRTSPTQSRTS